MRVTFLTSRLPPAVCGVGDHTRSLARAMAEEGTEVGFIHREPLKPGGDLPAGPVDRWLDTPASLVDCVRRQHPDWLWIQLSGYGYSRWGAPFALLRAVKALRRALPQTRLVVYMHETHCRVDQLGVKGPIVAPWQRHTMGSVARQADVVMTGIEHYRRTIVDQYGVPAEKVLPLPIGSNIPAARQTAEEKARCRAAYGWTDDETVAVTFGSWQMQLNSLEQHAGFLESSIRTENLHRVACVGGNSRQPPPELNEIGRWGPLAGRLTVFGYRPAEEVAQILACCDLGLAQPPRHLICKSSSFLAMVTNGLPVVTIDGGDPGHGLNRASGCTAHRRLASETLTRPLLASWGTEMRELSAKKFAWQTIAKSALSHLASTPNSLGSQCSSTGNNCQKRPVVICDGDSHCSRDSELHVRRELMAQASGGISGDPIYATFERAIGAMDLKGTLLDVGAGKGNLLRRLAAMDRFTRLMGADILSRPAKLPEDIQWLRQDLNRVIDIPERAFDVIVAAEVIEHLENPRAVFRDFFRILAPGGTLLLSTPNNESWRALIALMFRGHFVAFGDTNYPAHICALVRKDIQRMALETGFSSPSFLFTNVGSIPKFTRFSWQQISFGLLRNLRYSDNLLAVCKKPLEAPDS